MDKIPNTVIRENIPIDEVYRYRTQCGEFQCHRINAPDGMAGELIISISRNEKALSIEEVFVNRKFRNTGIGSCLLAFAEKTAMTSGFGKVELRVFSTDPLVPDHKLQEWYMKRGYEPDGEKMSKIINPLNCEVMI
ncbi:MAG: GNAT family N-acetyltransferase [Candidatus Methanoperedens sp.]|nr:GNAT family N-acetyltransferase [Candidatus Methanoperedens sp.]